VICPSDFDVSEHAVVAFGQTIVRPDRVPPAEWVSWWEGVTGNRNRGALPQGSGHWSERQGRAFDQYGAIMPKPANAEDIESNRL
jgi:hypothetical protein